MTRNGKIARLPLVIRNMLGRRLQNGEQGKKLVEWLNELIGVKEVVSLEFGGRPITEQNLSEWKQGGYQDWLKHQEAHEWVRTVSDEAEELTDESGLMPLSDRLSGMVALALGRVIRDLAAAPLKTARQRKELLELSRELTLLRKGDHKAAQLRIELERREEEIQKKYDRMDQADQHRQEWARFHEVMAMQNKEQMLHLITQGMSPEGVARVRDYVGMPRRKEPGQAGAPAAGDPTESDPIQPDPTEFVRPPSGGQAAAVNASSRTSPLAGDSAL